MTHTPEHSFNFFFFFLINESQLRSSPPGVRLVLRFFLLLHVFSFLFSTSSFSSTVAFPGMHPAITVWLARKASVVTSVCSTVQLMDIGLRPHTLARTQSKSHDAHLIFFFHFLNNLKVSEMLNKHPNHQNNPKFTENSLQLCNNLTIYFGFTHSSCI